MAHRCEANSTNAAAKVGVVFAASSRTRIVSAGGSCRIHATGFVLLSYLLDVALPDSCRCASSLRTFYTLIFFLLLHSLRLDLCGPALCRYDGRVVPRNPRNFHWLVPWLFEGLGGGGPLTPPPIKKKTSLSTQPKSRFFSGGTANNVSSLTPLESSNRPRSVYLAPPS